MVSRNGADLMIVTLEECGWIYMVFLLMDGFGEISIELLDFGGG